MKQIRVPGYPVREVSRHLGVSSPSRCKWPKLFAEPAPKLSGSDHEAENRRLKRKLARVIQKRDILKTGEPWCPTGSRTMANAAFARASR